jgi:hypothetical protein
MGDEDIAEEIQNLMTQLDGGSSLDKASKKKMEERLEALLQRQADIEKKSQQWRSEQKQQVAQRAHDGHGHDEVQGQDILHLIHPSSSSRRRAQSPPAYNPFSNSTTSRAARPGGFVQREHSREPLVPTSSASTRQHKFEPCAALAALTTLASVVYIASVSRSGCVDERSQPNALDVASRANQRPLNWLKTVLHCFGVKCVVERCTAALPPCNARTLSI